MGVRWIIGRAGTGKTAGCVREMRAEMQRDALGGALLWIVPEQATFMAERLLVAGAGGGSAGVIHGTFRAQVLSFRRLAMLIGRELGILGEGGAGAGASTGTPMDAVARVVLLEEMVREKRNELTVFGAVADRPGFIQKLDGMLRELRQQGHTAATLRELIDRGGLDAVMQRKLWDLAILLEGWSGVVNAAGGAEAVVDFEQLMETVAARTGESALIAGRRHNGGEITEPARVWVDGVSAMSGLEMRMLAALGQHAREVTITLLADPDSAALIEMRGPGWPGVEKNEAGYGLFARTERLHRRLTDLFRQKRVPVTETIALRERFRFSSAALGIVEAELWGGGRGGTDHGPRITDHGVKGGVELWECGDPETEVRAVAQAIRDLVIESGGKKAAGKISSMRYRQIGVIVPDMEGYGDALRRIFGEHKIPHFIDERRGMGHHPLVELLRSVVAIIESRWDREDLLLYMKTRLAGVSEEETAWVENYIIEHGITRVPWSEPWRWIAPNVTEADAEEKKPASARRRLAQVNIVREKVWNDLRPWWELVNGKGNTKNSKSEKSADEINEGAGWARELKALLIRLGVQSQIQAWAARATAAGEIELALMHEQAWREVEQLLAVLEGILAGKKRTLAQFARLLSTALESLTLALIPPTVDQVLVSSVTRSRVPELDVVFLVGAVEGQFPKVVEEDAILSDAQRELFNAASADSIGDGSDRQLLEMPFFDYVALTRAGRRLVVSFPLADRRGRAVGTSRYVGRLRDLLGDAITGEHFDSASRTKVARIGTVEDLLASVTAWAGGQVRGDSSARKNNEIEAAYNWMAASGHAETKAAMQLVWACVREKPEPRLGGDFASRFFPPAAPLLMSVSQLEKFAACPLQYFMNYTLGLRVRQEFALDAMNLGVLYHSILERVYRRIIAGEIVWPNCDARSLRTLLEEEVDAATEELHAELARRTPGYQRMCARTKRTLGIVLEADRRRACAGNMLPMGVEIWFGYGNKVQRSPDGRTLSLPVLGIQTPARHEVHLRGKIDRLDASEGGEEEASVIDYKSASQKKLDLDELLSGLSLQLPVYARAIHALGGYLPVAALYFGLGVRRKTVKHAGEASAPGSDEFYQQFQPHGIIDQALAARLDAAAGAQKNSAWYNIKFKKDGEPYANSELLSHADFATVLEYAAWKIAALADQLMDGAIAPDPYRKNKFSPCMQCDYASLCPFDRINGTYRELPKMGKLAAVSEMREKMAATHTQ